MNKKEIPKSDFDETINYISDVIEKFQQKTIASPNNHIGRISLLTKVIDQLENIRLETEKTLFKKKNNYPGVLPIHRGYTVDFRLKEFRKTNLDHALEIIPINSTIGEAKLLMVEEERPDIMKEMRENM